MRLINTTTLFLQDFFSDEVPNYAILSHRWEEQEVTLQDLRSGCGATMAGYTKIKKCCEQAVLDGWKYAWIDSCCIDKTSSAELSEAINSMFKWYRDAQVCYAYLSDVPPGLHDASFRSSKWFTRGWTLQELLAPEMVVFYDSTWGEIDTKLRLKTLISSITGISHLINFEDASVAQKMSCASRRKTTRVEDQAYCLMGLFKVNMPLLYGEGPNAFVRLQEEILKVSDDESIFAWTSIAKELKTVAYFKQQDSYDFSSQFVFLISTISATSQGFTILKESILPAGLMVPWSVRPYFSYPYENRTDPTQIRLFVGSPLEGDRDQALQGEIYFRDGRQPDSRCDLFVVVIKVGFNQQRIQTGVDLVVKPKDHPLHQSLNPDRPPSHNLDRVSRKLNSGRSVSVKIKKSGTKLEWKKYGVEVTVHQDGSLPWKDPNETLKTE